VARLSLTQGPRKTHRQHARTARGRPLRSPGRGSRGPLPTPLVGKRACGS
jgi:hypothetical protein